MGEDEESGGATSRALLIWLSCLATGAALKLGASVLVPVAFAAFLVAVFWPWYDWLARYLPRGIASVCTLLSFLTVVLGMAAGLIFAAEYIASGESLEQYRAEFKGDFTALARWSESHGLSVDQLPIAGSAEELAKSLGKAARGFAAGATLALALFTLGLLEVREYGSRLLRHDPASHERWVVLAKRVAKNFQIYVVVRTGVGLLTGALVSVASLLIGLEFPLLWGIINFLLNYVPTLGSIIGVVPPTLFAIGQFNDPGMVTLTLLAVGGVQLVMGNYIDPLIQGRYMKLSPVVVLLSLTLWGFVWGITGVLLAVPLTVLIILVTREFPSTRFFADLLASAPREEPGS